MHRQPVCLMLFGLAMALASCAAARANLVLNPGFESGATVPDDWQLWVDGTYELAIYTVDVHAGSQCLLIGGSTSSDFALLYQDVPNLAPNRFYELSLWARQPAGAGCFVVKMEFRTAERDLIYEVPHEFTPGAAWKQYRFTELAPPDTGMITVSLVAGFGCSVSLLVDDVALQEVSSPEPSEVLFDLDQASHTFMGFGAQIWGYGAPSSYPHLLTYRLHVLDELNIKYVRIENYLDSASWSDLQLTRTLCEARGIAWVYMIWYAPWDFVDGNGMLNDVSGFASWWVDHVDVLYDHGINVEYIELMNELDSAGAWSTGISPANYNQLVSQIRSGLDAHDGTGGTNDLTGVGIVGPGPAYIASNAAYIDVLDSAGIAAHAAWSTHAWGTDSSTSAHVGGPATEAAWPQFGDPADSQDPLLPKFVTEYATKETSFHGVTYPSGDDYGEWDENLVFPYYTAMNSMPYAVRIYENTLALLNSGANVAFVWQAIDEPTEVCPPDFGGTKRKAWGLVDLWGNPKPVYEALKTLYPKIPIGAEVVVASDQSDNYTYAGAYTKGSLVVVGIANGQAIEQTLTVRLVNADPDLRLGEATAFEQIYWGGPANGDPDIGQAVSRELALVPAGPGEYSITATLPADSTLTIICHGPGDIDLDGAVGPADFLLLAECLAGPEISTPPAGCSAEHFARADVDGDGDVDLADVWRFQTAFGGE